MSVPVYPKACRVVASARPKEHKQKGWATPYGFVDCKEPVTFEEACEIMKPIHEMFRKLNASKEEDPLS